MHFNIIKCNQYHDNFNKGTSFYSGYSGQIMKDKLKYVPLLIRQKVEHFLKRKLVHRTSSEIQEYTTEIKIQNEIKKPF